MGFEINGLDEFQDELSQMAKASEDIEGTTEVDFDDLFNRSFMQKHSNFVNFTEFLEDGNFIVNSQEDFEAIPDSELNVHVRKTTDFSSWEDMLGTATEDYLSDQLNF